MSKSRFGAPGRKARESNTRIFTTDVEEHPHNIVAGVRAIVDGDYGPDAMKAARGIAVIVDKVVPPNVESRLAVLVGTLRYGLSPLEATNAWNAARVRGQHATKAALQSAVALVRAAPASLHAVSHTRGKYRTVDLEMGFSPKMRASAAPEKRSKAYSTPHGMTAVQRGVFVKKL